MRIHVRLCSSAWNIAPVTTTTEETDHLNRQIARQRRKRTRNHEQIALLSRQLRTKLNTAKEKYHTETLSNFMVTSPHRFWRHSSQFKNNPHSIIMNGSVLHDQRAIASHYNTFFQSVFSPRSDGDASQKQMPSSFLGNAGRKHNVRRRLFPPSKH